MKWLLVVLAIVGATAAQAQALADDDARLLRAEIERLEASLAAEVMRRKALLRQAEMQRGLLELAREELVSANVGKSELAVEHLELGADAMRRLVQHLMGVRVSETDPVRRLKCFDGAVHGLLPDSD